MRVWIQAGIVALAAVAMAAPATAQRVRASEPVVVKVPAGTRVVRPATATTTAATTTAPRAATAPLPSTTATPAAGPVVVVPGGGSVERLLNGDYPAPGLGFDFAHHAAVNRNLDVRALIDPVTQHRLALAREIRRETPRAIPFPIFAPVTQVVVVNQPPQVILLEQQPEPPREPVERIRYVEREPAVPPPPPRELDELVLVLRDGTVLLAVAFSSNEERILLITPEGRRRAVALAEIDLAATEAANEERGTSLRLTL